VFPFLGWEKARKNRVFMRQLEGCDGFMRPVWVVLIEQPEQK